MNQKIKVSQGIQYVIAGLAVILFVLIWPMGVIQHAEVSKSDEVMLQESGPISVANNGTQMFIAEGSHLKAVDLYVLNDMQLQTITFRVYDGAYQQLWETFYVVDEKAQFPGFIRIEIDMEMQEGWEYYYTVEGLTADLYLAYEDTYESTSYANGTLLYGGDELPGMNIISRFHYTESFSWWVTLLLGALILGVAKGLCVLTDKLFQGKLADKNKEITVQNVIQAVGNPVLAVVTLLALLAVFPGRRFGTGVVNYGFYYLGIVIGTLVVFYGINYKRKGTEPLITIDRIKENWSQWAMAVCFAGMLWSCYEYMNGLYTIHHTIATRKLLVWFFAMLICTFPKEQILKIWNIVYLVLAGIGGYYYAKPYLGIEEEEEIYKLQAYIIVLGSFVLWQMVISLIQIIRKKEKVTAVLSLPYAGCLAVWFGFMEYFRNTRSWVTLMVVMFAIFYYCMWRWNKRNELLRIFGNGIILHFLYTVGYCLMHRPYLRFRYNRYGMVYHTVTMTGYYLALVLCAVIVRLFIQYKKMGRWQDCWKELSLLGMGNVYLFLTLSRTGYLAALFMQFVVSIFFVCLWEKKKLTGLLKTFALIIGVSIVAFPTVFTAQRILPAVCNDPIYSEIEEWDHIVKKGDRTDSELYIDIKAFVKLAGNKLFGIDMGNISIASIQEKIREEWKKLEQLQQPVYVEQDHYLLASEMDMYEEEDVSNGRFDIFREYIKNWNMTGHELMGVPLQDGTMAVHAHNTFLQIIHDHGMITGIIFLCLGVISLIYAIVRYIREKNMQSHLVMTIAVIIAFAAAGMVEWIFHICNPFGIALLIVVTPLLFRQKAE